MEAGSFHYSYGDRTRTMLFNSYESEEILSLAETLELMHPGYAFDVLGFKFPDKCLEENGGCSAVELQALASNIRKISFDKESIGETDIQLRVKSTLDVQPSPFAALAAILDYAGAMVGSDGKIFLDRK